MASFLYRHFAKPATKEYDEYFVAEKQKESHHKFRHPTPYQLARGKDVIWVHGWPSWYSHRWMPVACPRRQPLARTRASSDFCAFCKTTQASCFETWP